MEGSSVLVAGASGGIGRAIVLELLSAGAKVVLLGHDLSRLRAVIPEQNMPQAEFVVADLANLAEIEQVGVALGQRNHLDALVLSAGIYERSSDPRVLRRQLEANVVGPYALIQVLLPMLLTARGQIVFINSSQALKATGPVGQYAATMHAAKAIADSLRDEVNDRGVRVASLFLGRTAGDRQKRIFAAEGRSYAGEKLMQPEDVAQTVRFLLQLPRSAEVTDLTIRSARKP
jgi:NADP-dependent 3-hydroxy acid dehydrogenase YdfG